MVSVIILFNITITVSASFDMNTNVSDFAGIPFALIVITMFVLSVSMKIAVHVRLAD